MMTPIDIRMCVADAMQDDEFEDIESVLDKLNSDSPSSWRVARGRAFSIEEVTTAIKELIVERMVTACVESGRTGICVPISTEETDALDSIESLWFHLEQSGRDAVMEWWNSVGKVRFPL